MATTIKTLVEAIAELLGLDESYVLSALLEKGITNYSEFLRYLGDVQRQDRSWRG